MHRLMNNFAPSPTTAQRSCVRRQRPKQTTANFRRCAGCIFRTLPATKPDSSKKNLAPRTTIAFDLQVNFQLNVIDQPRDSPSVAATVARRFPPSPMNAMARRAPRLPPRLIVVYVIALLLYQGCSIRLFQSGKTRHLQIRRRGGGSPGHPQRSEDGLGIPRRLLPGSIW
jgi:hypothetical protein